MIPIKNRLVLDDFTGSPFNDFNTKLGLNSSISYDILMGKEKRYSFSPSVSYRLINYNYGYGVGNLRNLGWLKRNDHNIDITISQGYQFNNKISFKLGFSLETRVKQKTKGSVVISKEGWDVNNPDDPLTQPDTIIIILNNSQDENDYYVNLDDQKWSFKDNTNISCIFSFEYNIRKNIFLFSDLRIPVYLFKKSNTLDTAYNMYDNFITKSEFQKRRNIVLGVGYKL